MKARTAQEVWDSALGELQLQVSKANFRTWLQKTRALSYENAALVVSVPNTFVAEYLDKNLRSLIEKTLIGMVGVGVGVSFVVDGHGIGVPTALTAATVVHVAEVTPSRLARLNPRYTFDNFVVSNSNRLAHAAAYGAAEKPGLSNYNPLYIYGGVGLGKTHLLNAIGNAAQKKGRRVLYISAEQFTNEFISSLRERRMDDFRSRFRAADMLLIDDIQFIGGKEQTEETFFHIFNEMHDTDRQIALTSNCPPQSIPDIGDRLRSRLEWGLTAGIQAPDFETRLAILQAKAEKDGVRLDQDVLEFIADRIKHNIRELEGSLNRIVAYAQLLRTVVTPELASEALEDIATRQPREPIKPQLLLETIADYFQVNLTDLCGAARDRQTILARQVAMYFMREETDYSLSRIGKELGGKQAISVSQAHRKISADLNDNTELRQKVQDLQERLGKR